MSQAQNMIETAVIGGVMLHEGPYPPEVLTVEPEHFMNSNHAQMWMGIQDLISQCQPVEPVSLTAWLVAHDITGHAAYLCEMEANVPTCVNLGHWSKVLAEEGHKREIKRRVADEIGKMEQGACAEDVASRIQEVMRESRVANDGIQHVGEPLKGLLRELEDEHVNPNKHREIRTGISDIDSEVELRRGWSTIIAGRPGMGKSAMVGGICRYTARDGEPGVTALFSLEMDAVSLVRRMVAADSRIPTRELSRHIGDELLEHFNNLHRSALYIDDRPRLSIADMRSALTRLGRIKLVAVDYLQLAAMDEKLENQNLRVGEISKGLKAIAKDFDCHVIGLAQLNRGVERRNPPRPNLSDLRDSGEIEQDADTVLLLYREHYYNANSDPNDAEVIVAKSRHGRTGSIKIGWSPERQQFFARAKT